jgi:hypothetical protein
MSLYKITPELLKSTGASNGDVLTYVSANSRIEWAAPTGGGGGDASNAWANANDYTTYLQAQSNDFSTYSHISSILNSNVDTLIANSYNTYTTLSYQISNLLISNGVNIASQVYSTESTGNTFILPYSVIDANNLIVSISGLLQYPHLDYTVSGNVLTLANSSPLESNLVLEVRNLPDRTITTRWIEVTSNRTLVSGEKAIIDTSTTPIIVSLPLSPVLGDEVRIVDGSGNASNNNITIYGNGSNIEASTSNVIIDVDRAAFGLVYYNTLNGWLFLEL